MGNVSVTLLGGFSAVVDGVAVDPRVWRLQKGARARQAARARARIPPAPGAGDGCALARSRPGIRGEQPPSGGARRAPRARRGGDRCARGDADPHRRDRRRSLRADRHGGAAARDTRVISRGAVASTGASCCQRIGTTTGSRTGARSSPSWRSRLRRNSPGSPRTAGIERRRCRRTRARSSAANVS